MSVLWMGLTKTLDAFLMRRRDWKFFLLWVMREMIMSKSRLLTPLRTISITQKVPIMSSTEDVPNGTLEPLGQKNQMYYE